MKFPLRKVTLIDADQQALDDFRQLEKYILLELNCMELDLVQEEDKYVVYEAAPDNREIGSVLKKRFDKALKTKLAKLSNDELRQYIKDKKLMVNDIEIQDGWLKISKFFNK